MTDTQRAQRNVRRVESLLLSEALARRDIDSQARPTPECAPMPVLVEIAAGRLRGSADQRKHIYSCDFCLAMIRKIGRVRVAPLRIVARIAYPASWAACLAVGLLLGSFLHPATGIDSLEAWRGLTGVASINDSIVDISNRAAQQARRAGQQDSGAGVEALVEALREENSRLKNELLAVVGGLKNVHLGLQEVLQRAQGSANTAGGDRRSP